MENGDWLSRLLDLVPVAGALDYRCMLGAPWRIDFPESAVGAIPYHIILAGTAVLEDAAGGPECTLAAGDIVMLPHGAAHVLHDGGGAAPMPARNRPTLSTTFHENDGPGARLDMMCGHFILPARDRLIRSYLPRRLIVHSAAADTDGGGTDAQMARLVGLMRVESAAENLGGLAMLNALSTALFAFTLRLATELHGVPEGLLTLAANPRLAPALAALFTRPAYPWTLPELAGLCHMSRATFIRYFNKGLGRSATGLLADIRMEVAANALRTSDRSTGAVAELAGYESEAAFQRAFKHRMGLTPAQWRKNAGEG